MSFGTDSIFHKILHMGMAPWLDENKPDEMFADKIDDVKKVELEFHPRHKIDFYFRPFNFKTTYYHKTILNESNTFCNHIFHVLKNEDDIRVNKYLHDLILQKRLPDWLFDIGRIIKEKQYSVDYIDHYKYTFDIDEDHKTETYIMQLLKVALMWVYLEIQSFFTYIQPDELFIEDDLYMRFLYEPVPAKSYLIKSPSIITVQPEEVSLKSAEKEEVSLFSFRYKQFDKAPDKLVDFWDSLKKHSFISKDTTLPNFKKAFSGNPVSNPIVWKGYPTEFSFMVKLLHNKYKVVNDTKQKQWEIARECFIPTTGIKFPSNIRKLQTPASADDLEKIVKLLI